MFNIHFYSARFLRPAIAGVLVLLSLHSLNAAALAPQPVIADDTGNWTSSTVEQLQIRLGGFAGYRTSRVLIDEPGTKLWHPQHVLRLPNKIVDGKMRAFFAVTASRRLHRVTDSIEIVNGFPITILERVTTDGTLSVIQIDADAYDAENDVVLNTPGSDGEYVYEEHFNSNKTDANVVYQQQLSSFGDQFVISPHGDWIHPCKMTGFGGIMIMAGQNWSPDGKVIDASTKGSSLDALMFYDVSDPAKPQYLGKLDSETLGIDQYTKDGVLSNDDGALPAVGWRKIDTIDLTRSEDGYYHLGVQSKHFFCHESLDCFVNPDATKWTAENKILGTPVYAMGGGQGGIYKSLELYAEVPAANETCYSADGSEYLAGVARPADCAPGGTLRTMFFNPLEDSVNENSFSILCDWADEACDKGDANSQGIPSFQTLNYFDSAVNKTTLRSTFNFAGLTNTNNNKDRFYSQFTGECASSGGIFVTRLNEAVVYCPSESPFEPGGCTDGEAGVCNSLFQNRAASASAFGAVKLTTNNGDQVIYRGRGLRDISALSEPPWGPGLANGAVNWATTPIATIEVLSGIWQFHSGINYVGPQVVTGAQLPAFSPKSLRVIPGTGLTLTEFPDLLGRMVNNIRTNDNLGNSCGDNFEICAGHARADCNIFNADCDWPRSFAKKAEFALELSGGWSLNNFWELSGNKLGPLLSNTQLNPIGWGKEVIGVENSCIELAKPLSVRQEAGAGSLKSGFPRITWAAVTGANSYQIRVEDESGRDVTNLTGATTSNNVFVPLNPLEPGIYRWKVRAVNNNCEGSSRRSISRYSTPVSIGVPVILALDGDFNDLTGNFRGGTVAVNPQSTNDVYQAGAVVTLTAVPDFRSEFIGWGGIASSCGTSLECTLTLNPATAVLGGPGEPLGTARITATPNFRPKPRLVVTNGQGIIPMTLNAEDPTGTPVAGTACSNTEYICQFYPTGSTVAITPAVGAIASFVSWEADSDADCLNNLVTMDKDIICRAKFARSAYNFRVKAPAGSLITGDIVGGPSGVINCGADCEERFELTNGLKTVMLTATIPANYTFVRWSGQRDCWDEDEADGNPLTSQVIAGKADIDCSVEAVPTDIQYSLSVNKVGGGIITATALPLADSSGINCSLDACSQSYPLFSAVQLTAVATQGSVFSGYHTLKDDGTIDTNVDNECADGQLNMTANFTCIANFITNVLVVDGTQDFGPYKDQNAYAILLNQVNGDLGGINSDVWSVRSPASGNNVGGRAEPIESDLANYGRVIWYTGSTSVATGGIIAGPSTAAEASLASYLDAGGCLLMSSPEYFKDRGLTPFMQNYLGISAITPDVIEAYVKGAGAQSLGFSELSVDSFAGTLSAGYFGFQGDFPPYLSDALIRNPAITGTDALFTYRVSGAEAAVAVDSGSYRTAFFGFPFLGIGAGEKQINTMRAFMNYCEEPYLIDDIFEPNDTFASAAEVQGALSLTELRLKPANEDYFRWTSNWFGNTSFALSFIHAQGDLALEIYDSSFTLVGSSNSLTDNEDVTVVDVVADEVYYVRVSAAIGKITSYGLTVSTDGDRDHDGVIDSLDALPEDPTEQFDNDGDRIGDNADPDDDNDGLPDSYEILNGMNPLDATDAAGDRDGDGFTNLDEFVANTDPNDSNSKPFVQPVVVVVADPANDFDKDGLPNIYEISNRLNPMRAEDALEDTDGDGYTNLEEFIANTKPNDPSSFPTTPPVVVDPPVVIDPPVVNGPSATTPSSGGGGGSVDSWYLLALLVAMMARITSARVTLTRKY